MIHYTRFEKILLILQIWSFSDHSEAEGHCPGLSSCPDKETQGRVWQVRNDFVTIWGVNLCMCTLTHFDMFLLTEKRKSFRRFWNGKGWTASLRPGSQKKIRPKSECVSPILVYSHLQSSLHGLSTGIKSWNLNWIILFFLIIKILIIRLAEILFCTTISIFLFSRC